MAIKEDNIEEDIINAQRFINSIKTDKEYKEENGWHGYYNKEIVELAKILEHILSDYKRVLKENEELNKNYNSLIDKIILKIGEYDCNYRKAKRQNKNDIADYYWDLIVNFKKMLGGD
jgi:hypothetical protein